MKVYDLLANLFEAPFTRILDSLRNGIIQRKKKLTNKNHLNCRLIKWNIEKVNLQCRNLSIFRKFQYGAPACKIFWTGVSALWQFCHFCKYQNLSAPDTFKKSEKEIGNWRELVQSHEERFPDILGNAQNSYFLRVCVCTWIRQLQRNTWQCRSSRHRRYSCTLRFFQKWTVYWKRMQM